MASLVLEMQQQAMDSKVAVADVVRTALVVATKLNVPEFRDWCEGELHGYKRRDVPEYRKVEGQLKAWNPALGGFVPIIIRDADGAKALATRSVVQSIGELEKLYQESDSEGVLQMDLSPRVINEVFADTEEYQCGMVPTVLLGPTQIYAILEAVRNAVLEWGLRLEKDGIVGQGMTFSADEKRKAESVTYNIGHFIGVLGTLTADSVQIGDYNTIHDTLKRRGVPQTECNELEEILDGLPKAGPEERKSLLGRGTEWLRRNAAMIGTLSDTIRGWFEAFGG